MEMAQELITSLSWLPVNKLGFISVGFLLLSLPHKPAVDPIWSSER